MEAFCGSEFWNSSLTWNTVNPYFTPCFESTVINLIPAYFLILFGVSDLLTVHFIQFKCKTILGSFTIVSSWKAAVTLALALFQLIEISRLVARNPADLATVDYISPSLQLMAHMVVLGLSILTQYYFIHASGIQFFYWLLVALTQGIRFRTACMNYDDVQSSSKLEVIYLTILISYPLILVRLALEFVHNNALTRTQDFEGKLGKPSPELQSTFISKLLFFWYDNLTWTGYRRALNPSDLWDLNEIDTSRKQIDKFTKAWNQEVEKVNRKPRSKSGERPVPGVLCPLAKCYGLPYFFALMLKLTSDLMTFVQPTMLSFLVAHVSDRELEPTWKGYFYVAVLGITFITQSILNSSSHRRIIWVGMHARAALTNAVFRKSLVISSAAKREASIGEMVNLQAVDSQKIIELLPNLGLAFGGSFQIVIAIILLYNILGVSVLSGVIILICIIPFNLYIVALCKKIQMRQMMLKDERLKLTAQVLSGIKVLKLYAWEVAYQDQIEKIRKNEIKCLRQIACLNALSFFFFQMSPVLVAVASFLTFVYSSNENLLTPEITFVSINLFSIMRSPMVLLSLTLSTAMQTLVSFKRLAKFLNLEELDKSAVSHDDTHSDPIVVENATLSWTKKEPTLRNINFRVKQGELLAIVGSIGSGKTSLLSALLGDLEKETGIINTLGDIAFVSQSAWIQNATVRNNIIFGDSFHSVKYKRTLAACALDTDLKILDAGDETEIGEKGINLSGGQKQRVALARAAYKEASVYLFDDPLSAVDSNVGKHIFENLISHKGILRQKTRILVTHAISFLPKVDRILVMKNGQISECGTYRELIRKQGEFAEFLLQRVGIEDDEDVDPTALSVLHDLEEMVGADVVHRRSTVNRQSLAYGQAKEVKLVQMDSKVNAPKKLITEETVTAGNIKLSIFINYFSSAGIKIAILMTIFTFTAHGLFAFNNIWLSDWSTQTAKDVENGLGWNEDTMDKFVPGYGLIVGLLAANLFLEIATLSIISLAASRILHSKALRRVLHSPMSYFDTTPLGRILDRFSRDVDTLDNLLPFNVKSFNVMLFDVVFSLIVISYKLPVFIGFVVPITIVYIFLQRFYTSTSRQLKRLEGTSRSPIFSHFGETISGSSIIRAFHMEEDFIIESEKRVDENQKAYFLFLYSTTWVLIRLEFLGMLTVIATCIFTLLSRHSLDPGSAGLAITYSLQITLLLTILTRHSSDLEANIVSVERVEELTQTPQEASWEIGELKVGVEWPDQGQLIFDKYMTRYREGLDLVLTGISCKIESGEKIGVVGRTGAGKSSLTLALFRLIESASGKIYIDGIDISKLGLHELRKRITIIPQDPVLFSGSLRLNLDPFDHYSDAEVWRCLELAHLKHFVTQLKDGLYQKVEEDGQNFSVGQRQLICLARALLRKTKILVLDEATAAVDLETDDLIQDTIRQEFADSTVITIAHRLNTIVDSNRVMVLDQGEIKEFDSPQALLRDSTTIFWGMAKDAKLV